MQTAPGVFLLTLAILGLILAVGLTSLSTTEAAPSEVSYPAVILVFVALFGIVFFATRRRR